LTYLKKPRTIYKNPNNHTTTLVETDPYCLPSHMGQAHHY
jgi:hypothetical protein